jgi:IclR family acetate operon transcriptional repressor
MNGTEKIDEVQRRSVSRKRKDGGTDNGGGGVRCLSRALSILETLANSQVGITLTVLACAVGLPVSTAHRLLTTLQRQRFVYFDTKSMSWQIGVRAFVVGSAFARTRDIAMIARPFMRRLLDESGETVNLYVLRESEAMCMAQVEGRQTMRAIARPGGRVLMHYSGGGKALLAHLPERDVERVLEVHGLPRSTGRTIVKTANLKADLLRIRSRGFAVDDEEYAVGMRCVAAPIFDELGASIAALSLSGPAVRVSHARLDALSILVMNAARAATKEIGGHAAGELQFGELSRSCLEMSSDSRRAAS